MTKADIAPVRQDAQKILYCGTRLMDELYHFQDLAYSLQLEIDSSCVRKRHEAPDRGLGTRSTGLRPDPPSDGELGTPREMLVPYWTDMDDLTCRGRNCVIYWRAYLSDLHHAFGSSCEMQRCESLALATLASCQACYLAASGGSSHTRETLAATGN